MLPRIAAKASGDKIIKAIIAALGDRPDMIQHSCEAGKLLFAIVALAGIPFVNLDAILPHVVKVDIGAGRFGFGSVAVRLRGIFRHA